MEVDFYTFWNCPGTDVVYVFNPFNLFGADSNYLVDGIAGDKKFSVKVESRLDHRLIHHELVIFIGTLPAEKVGRVNQESGQAWFDLYSWGGNHVFALLSPNFPCFFNILFCEISSILINSEGAGRFQPVNNAQNHSL